MDNNIFISGVLLSMVFAIIYYLELRFISKKEIKMKDIFKYALLVYLSFIVSTFLYNQIESKTPRTVTRVFTEVPNF